jgi:hypothetical protein
MSEELEVLKAVAARFQDAGIPYMVTGSFAANFYATPRMTRDIDLVVELSEQDVDRVIELFQQEYYLDGEMILRAVQHESMFNMIHCGLVVKVDCIVRKDTEYRREEFAHRRAVSIEGQTVFMVAPEDLILSKLDWAKESRSQMQIDGDTSPDVEARYRAMLMQRTGEERLKMGCSMYATARALVEASIREQDPRISPRALRKAVFLRFYGHEFDAAVREKILMAVEHSTAAVSSESA